MSMSLTSTQPSQMLSGESKDTVVNGGDVAASGGDSTQERIDAAVKNRPTKPEDGINIAVSSRALFDLEEEHSLFEAQGLKKYIELQKSRENMIMKPGPALPFVSVIQHVNACLKQIDNSASCLFNIILMSHNSGEVGIRLTNSLQHYGLHCVERMCLSGGTNLTNYLECYHVHLFLTNYKDEAEEAIQKGFAAAALNKQELSESPSDQLRVVFDLDSVLFSDEAESVFKHSGLEEFIKHEHIHKDKPLPEGPLKPFATRLATIQQQFYKSPDQFSVSPLRTYIVTSRSRSVAERALRTLRSWDLDMDEAHFLSGADKTSLLKTLNPHIFFDDQIKHIEGGRSVGVASAHVISGAANKK